MLEAHPYADLFPMLDAADADALRDDISQHGVRDKIVIYHDRILDGRNRYRALVEIAKLGLLYRDEAFTAADIEQGEFFVWFTGSEVEALEFVLSKNLHRRHLTDSQRAHVAAHLANMEQGRPDKSGQMAGLSQSQAAERLHVSERQVRRATVVKNDGVAELNDAVKRGEMKISLAAQLARMSPEDQREVLAQHADRKALSGIVKDLRAKTQKEKAERRTEREQKLGARQQALPDRRYGVIIADPEWKYEAWSVETGSDRSPDNHYPCSDLPTIMARPVGDIAADDCALFLWVTTPFLDAGFEVMKAWGFDYKSAIVWGKERVGDGRGTGYWFLGEHETVLFGTRGNVPAPIPGQQFPSFFLAPVGEHSAKPDKIHEIAEAYFPNMPKIELNARRKRAGWDVWGNESDGGEDAEGQNSQAAAVVGAQNGERVAGADCALLAAPGERVRAHAGSAVHDRPATAGDIHRAGDARDQRRGTVAGGLEAKPAGEKSDSYAGPDSDVGIQNASLGAGASGDAAGRPEAGNDRFVSPVASPNTEDPDDANFIRVLTCRVADDLGLVPTDGFKSCLAKADKRRLRHAVILAAHEQHGLSLARIGAVLGIRKQTVHEQLQAAKAEAGKVLEVAE